MTKAAVIKGTAKWIERNVIPNLVPRGALRVGLSTALKLAATAPEIAVGLLAQKFPMLPTLLTVADDAKAFDAVMGAFKDAAKDENGMVVQFCEIGLWNNSPHALVITGELIDELGADIKSAATAEKNAELA